MNRIESNRGKQENSYLQKILGTEFHKEKNARKLWLSQKSDVEKVLGKLDMSNSKVVSIPLENHFKL